MNAGLFALCSWACGETGRGMFGLDKQVDRNSVSKLLNLST